MKWLDIFQNPQEIDDVLRQCLTRRTDSRQPLFNVLFLDYDGVINVTWSGIYDAPFESDLVENVNTLCHMFDLKIVVTSSWRNYDGYKEFLINSGLAPDIEILGRTDKMGVREKEIMQYLLDEPYVGKFIILDDYPMPSLKKYQVITRYPEGFNSRKLAEAIELLQNQPINI